MMLYHHKPIFFSFIFSLFLIIVGLSVAFVALGDSDHLLIIHFDSFQGIDVLGSRRQVFNLLLTGLAINFINYQLTGVFYRRERFFAFLLAFSNILISFLILLAILVIISIN